MATILTNKFTLVGTLDECRFDIFDTHLRYKICVDNITVSGMHQKKWQQDAYIRMVRLGDKLHTNLPSAVYADDELCGYLPNDTPTRLYVTGSLMPSADGRIWFNADYVAEANPDLADSLSIELAGQWCDVGFMNMVNDSPRVFQLPKPTGCEQNAVYAVSCLYKPSYAILDDIVTTYPTDSIVAQRWLKMPYSIPDDKMKNLLLEWEITA